MGFLNRYQHIRSVLVLTLFILSGCSVLRLRDEFRPSPDDWTMYGGNRERTNSRDGILRLPLKLLWEYDASAGFAASPCALADSILLVGNLQGEVHAVDAMTGRGKGNHDFGSAISATPAVSGEFLYIPLAHDEASLLCYDLMHARIVWKAKLGDIESAPLLEGDFVYVTTLAGTLVCLERITGNVAWTFGPPPGGTRSIIHSSPASDGSLVVFGSDQGVLSAVDRSSGRLRWQKKTGSALMASPSITSGLVIIGSLDGSLSAYALSDGALRWTKSLGGKIFESQAVAGKTVVAGTSAGTIACLDWENGQIRWQYHAGAPVSPPMISGGVVYAGCLDKTVLALDLSNGTALWQYRLDGRIKSAPLAWNGRLFVFAEDHSVFAFGPAQ
jgi:outer membrane protein assembly factor BamB